MDWEVLGAIGFILLATPGLVYAGLGAWYYFRSERRETNGVSLALVFFVLQYGLAYGVGFGAQMRAERLLPTILMFLIATSLVFTIRVGFRASSKAGSRIGLAGILTLSAYSCIVPKFFFPY